MTSVFLASVCFALGPLAWESPSGDAFASPAHECGAGQGVELAQYRDPKNRPAEGGYRTSLLPGEEALERHVPAQPRTVEDAKRIEARKQYLTGYMQMSRKRLHSAAESFKKALENNPTYLPALRDLVVLSFTLERAEEGLEYCRRALELEPDNYELLHLFATRSEERGDLQPAIDALERASRSPKLRSEKGRMFLEIRFDLARMYERAKNYEGRAAAMRDVIDIAEHPRKYGIDLSTRRRLQRGKVRYYEALGQALRKLKKYDEAIEVLEKGRAIDPIRGPRLAKALALIHLDRGEKDRALEELQKAVDRQLQDTDVFELYGKTLADLGREDELLGKLSEALKADGENPVLRRYYVRRLIDAGQFAEAEKLLDKIKNEPESLPLLAKVYRQRDEPKQLLESLARALAQAQEPAHRAVGAQVELQIKALAEDPAFVLRMADAARELDAEGALDRYAKFVVASTARAANRRSLGRLEEMGKDAGFVTRVAEIRKADGEQAVEGESAEAVDLAENASRQADVAMEFYRSYLEDQPGQLQLLLEMAYMLEQNERWSDMVDVCDQAIKIRPGEFVFQRLKAHGLEYEGKTDEAVKVIEGVLAGAALQPTKLLNGYFALARIYQHAKRWDQAIDYCRKIIDEFGASERAPLAMYMLAGAYTLKGDLLQAEEELLKLLQFDPQKLPRRLAAACNNDLGYIWADEGRHLDRAEKMIRKAIEFGGENAAYLDSMGWVLFKRGKFDEAIGFLEKAVARKDGSDAVIWDHLGDAYLQIDKVAEATKAWEKSIFLYLESKDDKSDKIAEVRSKLQVLRTKKPNPKREPVGSP